MISFHWEAQPPWFPKSQPLLQDPSSEWEERLGNRLLRKGTMKDKRSNKDHFKVSFLEFSMLQMFYKNFNLMIKKWNWGWRDCSGVNSTELLLQRIRIQFPALMMASFQTPIVHNSSSRGSDTLLWPPKVSAHWCTYAHIDMHTNT